MIDEALAQMEKASALEGDDAVVRDRMGDVYYRKGFEDKAEPEWRKSLEIDPAQEKVREKLKKIAK